MDEAHESGMDITGSTGEAESCEIQVRTVAILTGVLAHEIRNPLGTIANVLFALGQSHGHDPATSQRLQLAQGAVERIAGLPESLLLFSRVGLRSPEELDLRAFLPDVERHLLREAENWWVRASPDMLQLALRLIVQPVGSVEGHRLLDARRQGPWVVLSFGGASEPQEHLLREWAEGTELVVCLVRVLIESQGGFLREEWLGKDHRLTVGLKRRARARRAA